MKIKRASPLMRGIFLSMMLVTLLLPACAAEEQTPTPVEAQTPTPVEARTLKFAWYPITGETRSDYMEKFASIIEDNSGGRLNIDTYPGEQLVKGKESYDAVTTGAVDMTYLTVGWFAGIIPLASAVCVSPLAIREGKVPAAFREGGLTAIVQEEFDNHNMKWLWTPQVASGQILAFKEPVHTLEDFNGRFIRALAGSPDKVVILLGAKTVNISVPEIYEAAQRGIINGTLCAFSSYCGRKIYEVLPYTINPELLVPTVAPVVMNLETWNSLPPDLQKVILDAGAQLETPYFEAERAACADLVQDLGVTQGLFQFEMLPDQERARWIKAIEPVHDDLVQEFGEVWKRVQKIAVNYR